MEASRIVSVLLLSFAYALGICMLFGNVYVTPLAAVYLTEGNAVSPLQTVPLSVLVACSAVIIPLCGVLFSCIQGYKGVFIGGALAGLTGSLVSFCALYWGVPGDTWAFALLVVGCALQGCAYGVIHFYRHVAASELSTDSFKPWAIAIVLSGGIVAGILGPQIGIWSTDLIPGKKYSGVLAVLSGVFLTHVLVIACVRLPKPTMPDSSKQEIGSDQRGPRSLLTILASLPFLRSVVPGLSFHATMVGIMALCPEIVKARYDPKSAANVITVHVVAMYVPSLLVPIALKRVRHEIIITAGACLISLGFGLFVLGNNEIAWFYAAMSLVGVGWNCAFVPSTALLGSAIEHPAERFKVQAANDSIVFGAGSIITLLSGVLLKPVGVEPILIFFGCWCALALALSWYFSVVNARRIKSVEKTPHNMQETEQLLK